MEALEVENREEFGRGEKTNTHVEKGYCYAASSAVALVPVVTPHTCTHS